MNGRMNERNSLSTYNLSHSLRPRREALQRGEGSSYRARQSRTSARNGVWYGMVGSVKGVVRMGTKGLIDGNECDSNSHGLLTGMLIISLWPVPPLL